MQNVNLETLLKWSLSSSETLIKPDVFGEISKLINKNPFRERIIFLLENQQLANTPIKNLLGIESCPNCIGTALFIAGVSPFNYPYHAYENELDLHMNETANKFLPEAFVFSYNVMSDDWHVGIYLGKINEDHIAFAQHGHGNKFGPESLYCNYCTPHLYVQRNLVLKHSSKIIPSTRIYLCST